MKCRAAEQWIADGPEAVAAAGRETELAAHLEHCPGCARLAEELAAMPAVLNRAGDAPDPNLVESTRALCLAALDSGAPSAQISAAASIDARTPAASPVPLLVRLVLAALTALTIVFALSFFAATIESGDWTAASTAGLVLILQNLVMLLCAPLLLRRRSAVDGGTTCA